MKHESEFVALDDGFGHLPDAPLPMPKQQLGSMQRSLIMLVFMSLFTLARSRP